jgi:hypothetical protein
MKLWTVLRRTCAGRYPSGREWAPAFAGVTELFASTSAQSDGLFVSMSAQGDGVICVDECGNSVDDGAGVAQSR